MRFLTRTLVAAAIVHVVGALSLSAQTADGNIIVHGFGGWGYGRTAANNYLDGLPNGNYRHASMAISIAAPVNERLTIRAQGESVENEDGSTVTLDYAFADYALTDNLSLRLGQVKHPFGIFTEVFTVGTLRPFLELPQAIYGPVGFAGQAYNGIGLSGHHDLGAWTVSYDVYGGGYTLEEFHAPEAYFHGQDLQTLANEIETESTRDVVGTRVTMGTPLHGLSFGVSSYTGVLAEVAGNRRTVVGAHVDYRGNRLTVEAEAAHEDEVRDQHVSGGYVQAAYRFAPSWQAGVQYDDLSNEFLGVSTASAPSLTRHREVAGVLSYWFSRAVVIKAEYHVANGNRLAMPDPESFISILQSGRLRTTTSLAQFGAQFSF